MSDMELVRRLVAARAVLDEAVEEHQPAAILGLMSGGHDSYTVTHFAAEALGDRLTAVCHIDTGIGIPETRTFVEERCAAHGWPLKVYAAAENVNAKGEPDPQIYDDIVMEHGFPGPASHGMMYARLKERQIRRMVREHKAEGRPLMLISGVRKEESARRLRHTDTVQVEGSRVFVAPFAEMSGSDLARYMSEYELPRNPVKDRLCMSGECLCGAFAKPGELREIAFHYPEVAERIRGLQRRVIAAGFPWGWEDERPPAGWTNRKSAEKAGQSDAFDAEFDEAVQHLCRSCAARAEVA